MDAPRTMTIAEVAKETGTSAHTLRYYERIGLIRPVGRAGSGHRRYCTEDVRWVTFLRHLHATGMPIRRMLDYAQLAWKGESTFTARREILEAHRDDVAAKVKELGENLRKLDTKIGRYVELERQQKTGGHPETEARPRA